jgi:hypothetical protein
LRNPDRELASPSAARLSGDDYQHVFTLMHAVRLLREDVWGIQKVAMEVDGAGNVDDLIVFYGDRPALYHQIKFSRQAGEPLEHTWFTDPGKAKKSPLKRFHESSIALAKDGVPPEMALVTNRILAAGDPVLEHLEGRDGRLTPRLSRPGVSAATKKARAGWAAELEISEAELFELLDHLRIEAGQGTLEVLRDRCGDVMMAAGLRGDADAVILGNGAIRDLIEAGHDHLDRDAMTAIVDRHGLRTEEQVALLDVAAIDRAPFAGTATAALDWVDYYEGTGPRERRRLVDPASAQKMGAELVEARRLIQAAGYSSLMMRGAFRLDVGFALGAEFADSAGFRVSYAQRDELWRSDADPERFDLAVSTEDRGRGTRIAVCVSVNHQIAEPVASYLASEGIEIARLIELTPAGGLGPKAIGGPAQASGCAHALVQAVRDNYQGVSEILLFLACPNGLAILLGNHWNRMPRTLVHADVNPGYEPTFQILG